MPLNLPIVNAMIFHFFIEKVIFSMISSKCALVPASLQFNFRTFPSLQKDPWCKFVVISHSQVPGHLSSVFYHFHLFWTYNINEIRQYVVLCFWLLSPALFWVSFMVLPVLALCSFGEPNSVLLAGEAIAPSPADGHLLFPPLACCNSRCYECSCTSLCGVCTFISYG